MQSILGLRAGIRSCAERLPSDIVSAPGPHLSSNICAPSWSFRFSFLATFSMRLARSVLGRNRRKRPFEGRTAPLPPCSTFPRARVPRCMCVLFQCCPKTVRLFGRAAPARVSGTEGTPQNHQRKALCPARFGAVGATCIVLPSEAGSRASFSSCSYREWKISSGPRTRHFGCRWRRCRIKFNGSLSFRSPRAARTAITRRARPPTAARNEPPVSEPFFL